MNEEMNLTEDTNLEESFDSMFVDETEEQDTNVQEVEDTQNDGETAENTPRAEEEPKYKVNFLGEEKEFPVSELVTAAQKGMNYDHIKEERDNLKNQTAQLQASYSVMEQMAQANGLTVEQYADLCNKTLEDNKIKAQVDRGVPEDIAKRILHLEEKENIRNAEEAKRQNDLAVQQQYGDLAREYPDVKTLPDEVVEAIANGETPLYAYRAYENKMLKNKLAVLEKTEENKQKTTGSLQSDVPEETDDFMIGFNS